MPQLVDTAIKESPFAILAAMNKCYADVSPHTRNAYEHAVRFAEAMDDDEWYPYEDPREIDRILIEELDTTLDTLD